MILQSKHEIGNYSVSDPMEIYGHYAQSNGAIRRVVDFDLAQLRKKYCTTDNKLVPQKNTVVVFRKHFPSSVIYKTEKIHLCSVQCLC